MINHTFKLLLIATIQQDWKIHLNSAYSYEFSPSKQHWIPQNVLLPYPGKFCTMYFVSVWKSSYFSFPVLIVFYRRNMLTDRIRKIFRMTLRHYIVFQGLLFYIWVYISKMVVFFFFFHGSSNVQLFTL